MDAIGHFLGRVFGNVIDRFLDRVRYAISDATEAKIRETVEKPFQQLNEADNQKKKVNNYQDPDA
jgi:hypothetical protein